MSVSALKDIRAALSVHLTTIQVADAPRIAYENEPFVPLIDEVYLSESILPSDKSQVGTGDGDTDNYEGIYQVNVHGKSQDLLTRFAVETQAEAVENLFVRGAEYTEGVATVKIRKVFTGVAVSGQGWYFLPVEIHYQALV